MGGSSWNTYDLPVSRRSTATGSPYLGFRDALKEQLPASMSQSSRVFLLLALADGFQAVCLSSPAAHSQTDSEGAQGMCKQELSAGRPISILRLVTIGWR